MASYPLRLRRTISAALAALAASRDFPASLQCSLDLAVQTFRPAPELVVKTKPPEKDFDFSGRSHSQARALRRRFTGRAATGLAAGARRGMKK
jgi:hypothetical protein